MTGDTTAAAGHRRASIGARRNPEAEAAILDAARALLAERGYAGFSIEEVARRAGAGKPTIYRWWPTKADLFIDVYSAEKSATLAPPRTGALWSDLLAYTRALWAFWRDTPSGRTFRALIAEAQASAPALVALRDKFLPQRLKDVRRMFEEAAARGEIEPQAVEHLLTLYIGFNWVHLLTDRIADDPEGIEIVARTLAARRQ
ncbi:TetR/AcrR family transcriptional regulator [Xanthobacter sp. V4C-4]|uniref:TetR/AcrR family transcriptional regulator n=1 Tax=Xanthobacter cornucopiae TaxID=3119924 RepID=UPI00372B76D9